MFPRDSNKEGRNGGQSRERSNENLPMRNKCLTVAKEVEESSGCINIYPIPPLDQTVLRRVVLELS